MKRYIILGALLVALTAKSLAQNLVPEEIARRAEDATVYIETYDAQDQVLASATGFIYEASTDPGTHAYQLVTNAHVLKGARAIKLTGETGENLKFEGLYGYDEELDIAVIHFDWGDYHNRHVSNPEDWQGLHLAYYQPSIGQHIYVAGHPLGLGFTFSEGMVSALY